MKVFPSNKHVQSEAALIVQEAKKKVEKLNASIIPTRTSKKAKVCDADLSESDSDISSNNSEKHEIDNSTPNNSNIFNKNNSLDVSINKQSVGPVLKNKKQEVLKSSKEGSKKNVCYYCFEERQKTKNLDKKIFFSNLVDHYETAHAKESDIKELMKIPIEKVRKGKSQSVNQKRRVQILENTNIEDHKKIVETR